MKGDLNKDLQKLLDDDLFIQWINHPTTELDEFWESELAKNEYVYGLVSDLRKLKVQEPGLSYDAMMHMWNAIEKDTIHEKRIPFRSWHWLTAVASVLVLFLVGRYFWPDQEQRPAEIDYQSMISSHTAPSSNNVVLVLSENEQIDLETKNAELSYNQEGEVTFSSGLDETNKNKPAAEINQLIVPYGKTSVVTLSDQTKIWVNSGTKVLYPVVFNKDKREIFVEGEIFIDVSKSEIPFVVKTDQLEVKVYGTSFNVSAYKNDPEQSVVLASGLVSVTGSNKKTARLNPNQMYQYNHSTKEDIVRDVDVDNYTSWIYGYLSLKNEKLSSTLNKLERYYNIPIRYSGKQVDEITVSGKLDLKDHLPDVLRSIAVTTPISYEFNDDFVTISVNPKNNMPMKESR